MTTLSVSWHTIITCRWLNDPLPTSCPLRRTLNPGRGVGVCMCRCVHVWGMCMLSVCICVSVCVCVWQCASVCVCVCDSVHVCVHARCLHVRFLHVCEVCQYDTDLRLQYMPPTSVFTLHTKDPTAHWPLWRSVPMARASAVDQSMPLPSASLLNLFWMWLWFNRLFTFCTNDQSII